MRNGARHWNNTDTPIRFNETSGANNTVEVLDRHVRPDRSDTLGVRRRVSRTGTNLTRWEIEMYDLAIREHATRNGHNLLNVVTNVFEHELGHVLGLADNPTGVGFNGSVMNSGSSRNRNTVPGITQFDVQSVNWLYE